MVRERIIEVALACFARYGIKAVSMNQITVELGISKRTLYNEFENKDQLLAECIDYGTNRLLLTVEKMRNQAKSPVEAIFSITTKVFSYKYNYCPAFYKDLMRFHLANEKILKYKNIFTEKCESLIKQGVGEGYFLLNLSCKVVALFFIEQISDVKSEYQLTLSYLLIRGICTDKGLAELTRVYTASK